MQCDQLRYAEDVVRDVLEKTIVSLREVGIPAAGIAQIVRSVSENVVNELEGSENATT